MPLDPLFWYGLALKMTMTAGIVVIVLVTVGHSGPFVGALIAALPTVTGATYVISAIEHPAGFIAASALGSIAIGAAVSIFAASYAMLAQRHGACFKLEPCHRAVVCGGCRLALDRVDAA